jgi:hypothetical protein
MFTNHTPRFIIPATAAETGERFYLRDTSGWWVGCRANEHGIFGQHCRFLFTEEVDATNNPTPAVYSETLTMADREEINHLPIIWWYMLYADVVRGTWMVMQCQYSKHSTMTIRDRLGQTGV